MIQTPHVAAQGVVMRGDGFAGQILVNPPDGQTGVGLDLDGVAIEVEFRGDAARKPVGRLPFLKCAGFTPTYTGKIAGLSRQNQLTYQSASMAVADGSSLKCA